MIRKERGGTEIGKSVGTQAQRGGKGRGAHGSVFIVHGSQFTVRISWFTVPDSWFTIRSSPFTIHSSRFAVHGSRFTVHDSRSAVHRSRFMIRREGGWVGRREGNRESEGGRAGKIDRETEREREIERAREGGQESWLVVLRLNVPVNNFSVMSGRSHRFLGNSPVLSGSKVSCSRTQHGGDRSRTPDLSFRSPTLYH